MCERPIDLLRGEPGGVVSTKLDRPTGSIDRVEPVQAPKR